MTGSDIERQRVSEASPSPGESVWDFLERHAERLGIMMWMDPRGRLTLGYPDYKQEPLYRFVRRYVNDPEDPNNFRGGSVKKSGAGRFSKVTVTGRSHGRGTTRGRVQAVIEDTTVPFVRERTEQDASARTVDECTRAAKRLIREGVASSEVFSPEADDHGQGRYLYAINTTCDVVDELAGIEDKRFVVARTFTRSRTKGTSTSLRILPLNSLTL